MLWFIGPLRMRGDLHAQLAEIDENLMRSELTPAQRAAHVARREKVWEALHPRRPEPDPRLKLLPRGTANTPVSSRSNGEGCSVSNGETDQHQPPFEMGDGEAPISNRTLLDDGGVGGATCATNEEDLRKDGRRKGPQHQKEFAAATAEVTGESKSTINRQLAVATALGEEGLQKVTGTSLDKGVSRAATPRDAV